MNITVSVVALGVIRSVNDDIRLQESPNPTVINPPVHMHDIQAINHFMAGKPAGGFQDVVQVCRPRFTAFILEGVQAVPPGVEAEALDNEATGIEDVLQAAQVVFEQIAGMALGDCPCPADIIRLPPM